MPQSLAALHSHIIFSTKSRYPFIDVSWKNRLYDYIGGIINLGRGHLLAAGGTADHVHLMVSMGREWSLSNLVREVKSASSKWIHTTIPNQSKFAWQSGYAAFSVDEQGLDGLRKYLDEQEEHHRVVSFQEEFRDWLRKHKLEWDEKYVWD